MITCTCTNACRASSGGCQCGCPLNATHPTTPTTPTTPEHRCWDKIEGGIDRHGNRTAREGCDRCACGCKYWEEDRCTDCGAPVSQAETAAEADVMIAPGGRVRLVRCTDEYTQLQPGIEGTVVLVDDFGTIHVRWDDGHSLGLVTAAGDRYEVIA